jgi:SAM-dependent methyltransferase
MSSAPHFDSRDPAQPDFWQERFAAGFTPWDAGGVPPPFTRWLRSLGRGRGRRVLVPGCGAAYEVAALDAAGFAVTAIDYAAAAVARARVVLGDALADRTLRQADFFEFDAAPFDLVYERAFLAALPPRLAPRWAARLAQLLAPGGCLAGLFLVEATVPVPRRGPPFATTAAELHTLLGGAFTLAGEAAVPPEESLAVFAGRERWLDWVRRAKPSRRPRNAGGHPDR